MSYTAILFMCNDYKRAEFTIDGFTRHNPDIPLIVYNGGEPARDLADRFDIDYREGPNMWKDITRMPPGSWGYEWYKYMFHEGLHMDTDHLIYLETDVQTNRKIEVDPKYDLSGPVTSCGPLCSVLAYDFWGSYLHDRYDEKSIVFGIKTHTGMGATAFSKNFFEKAHRNLKYVKLAEEKIPLSFYCDLNMTLLATFSGCSYGDWSEVSDNRGTFRKNDDGQWYVDPNFHSAALIHNVKV